MQTAIRALQEVDPLIIYWQTVLSRSKSVLIRVSITRTSSIRDYFFQKHEILIESDLSLSSFLLGIEISDPEKEY